MKASTSTFSSSITTSHLHPSRSTSVVSIRGSGLGVLQSHVRVAGAARRSPSLRPFEPTTHPTVFVRASAPINHPNHLCSSASAQPFSGFVCLYSRHELSTEHHIHPHIGYGVTANITASRSLCIDRGSSGLDSPYPSALRLAIGMPLGHFPTHLRRTFGATTALATPVIRAARRKVQDHLLPCELLEPVIFLQRLPQLCVSGFSIR